jgi:hypothetical protein
MNCSKCNSILPDIEGIIICSCGQLNQGQEVFPSLLTQATNFISSSVKHIKTGMKTVPEEVKKERLDICNSCEYYKENRCTQCGCYMNIKTEWAEQECPLKKWLKYEKDNNSN